MIYLLQILLFLCFSCTCLAQNTYVFVGTYNKEKSKEGIVVYKLDNNGLLTKLSAKTDILNPSYLAVGSDSNFIYACTESQTKGSGYISSFRFDTKTAMLEEINRKKTSGDNPVYLTTDNTNRFLVSVNYTESSVDVFPISPNGALEDRIQSIRYYEGSKATDRQLNSHAHSVIFSPDCRQVLIPDLGADEIKAYQFNSSDSLPLKIDSYIKNNATPGSGPRHIRFHPNGRNVYCIEEIGGALGNYSFKDGRLALLQHLSLHEGENSTHSSAELQLSPDGKFLYASNRGTENNIVIFSINNKAILKRIGFQSTLGDHPRMFGISPDGRFLIVANQYSNNLVVFRRNLKTGRLTATEQRIQIYNPSCVQMQVY